MTQNRRVLRALRRHPEGVCQVEFLLPNVLDGGAPITRLAARVRDLKDRGYDVQVEGERYGTAVYKLASAQEQAPGDETPRPSPAGRQAKTEAARDQGDRHAASPQGASPLPAPAPALFDIPPARRSIYDPEAA